MTAPCIVTWWRGLLDPQGREETLDTWSVLFDRFERVEPFRGQNEHPGWSPARFDPCQRGLENVRGIFALCLDYDGGEPIDAALDLWSGFFGFLHTSRKHTADAHRFRVILPFSRVVSPFEFDALWRRINAHAAGKLDPAPKDASRFWFCPGIGNHEGAEYRTARFMGAELDPDEILRKPEPSAQRERVRDKFQVAGDVERRAIAYISKMPEAIEGQGGQRAIWAVALVLAKGFGLTETRTLEILRAEYNPRCTPEWSEKELAHTAKNAARATVPDGFKLDDDREYRREWSSRQDELPAPPDDDPDYVPEPPDEWPAELGARETASEEETGEAPEGKTTETKPAVERYGFLSMVDLMQSVVDELNKPRPRTGARTGAGEFDEAIGGYRHGNVTVFGAKRGFGKTSYGNLVTSMALPELRVGMFAGEDSAAIYGKRFLAMHANLNAMNLRDYRCNREDWPRIARALETAPRNPFFVRVDGRPVEWIAKAIREVGQEQGLDLVIVDYLQCLKTSKRLQDRRNEVTYVCKSLSDAIKAANAAGLIFSQLKRTERLEPEIEDLKESGDIEDMADHILLGWKVDASAHGEQAQRCIKLAKNKDGLEASEAKVVTMRWDRRTASFQDTPAERDEHPGSEFDDLSDDFATEERYR